MVFVWAVLSVGPGDSSGVRLTSTSLLLDIIKDTMLKIHNRASRIKVHMATACSPRVS